MSKMYPTDQSLVIIIELEYKDATAGGLRPNPADWAEESEDGRDHEKNMHLPVALQTFRW